MTATVITETAAPLRHADERFLRRILIAMIAFTLGCGGMTVSLAYSAGPGAPAPLAASSP